MQILLELSRVTKNYAVYDVTVPGVPFAKQIYLPRDTSLEDLSIGVAPQEAPVAVGY